MTNGDTERTGVILENLCAESYGGVREAYNKATLNFKYIRDEDSAEMLNLVFDTGVFNLADALGITTIGDLLKSNASNGNPDIASSYAKVLKPSTKLLDKSIAGMIIRIDSQVNAAAKSNITHVDNYKEKNIVYWYIGNSYVCGAYLVGGNLILGKDKHACQFGAMRFSDGETLEGKLEKCDDIEAYADTLSSAVGTVIRILSPHLLIIEYDAKFVCSDIIPLIKTNLIEKYGITPDNCQRGLCLT